MRSSAVIFTVSHVLASLHTRRTFLHNFKTLLIQKVANNCIQIYFLSLVNIMQSRSSPELAELKQCPFSAKFQKCPIFAKASSLTNPNYEQSERQIQGGEDPQDALSLQFLLQKSPTLSGSFTKNDLQRKVSYESSQSYSPITHTNDYPTRNTRRRTQSRNAAFPDRVSLRVCCCCFPLHFLFFFSPYTSGERVE